MATQRDEIADLQESYLERRDMLLKDVEPVTIRRAWFALAHLLLDEGARVVDMGCDDGAMTYAMAAMAPKIKFTGLDKSKRQISKAREKYSLHNLEFVIGDVTSEIFEEESVDAIINSYVLHEVYSGLRYNERIVGDTLKKHFKILKKGGVMFTRDFTRPPPGEYVLMEMPDTPSEGDTLAQLSEPELLVWYSEHARPRSDPGTGGFFLEELPPRFPRTRLFRLPHKWAYEFIMRKDNRAQWELGLPLEYTFFTERDFIKEFSALGARVQYAGPHWEEEIIDKNFEGKFKLYADDGTPLGHPPTSFVTVAYKMQERKSLYIQERRPSGAESNRLKINAVRDEKSGQITDVVSRGFSAAEIIPYRLDEEGRLKIFLHDGVARPVANAVPRNGTILDGRSWSGHMIEPVAVDGKIFEDMGFPDVKSSARFSRDHLGLIPRGSAVLEHGPDYYPAPEYIDERIYTYYLRVEPPKSAPVPRNFIGHTERFHAKGLLREMDAQQVLNAISVGMIPNGRLELQILSLYGRLNQKAENCSSKNVPFQVGNITKQKSLHKLMKQYQQQNKDKRFRDIKGTAGQLRPVHSMFVEEGQARGAVTGLSAQDADFVVFDDQTINTAVVLPLAKDLKNDVHAGFFLHTLPVPQLHQPGSLTMSAPSFHLPRNVTNIQQAKKFIAEQFGVFPQMVFKIGESYYNHIGVTPQRIHPFGVAVPPDFFGDRKMEAVPLYQIMLIRQKLGEMNVNTDFRLVAARAYMMLGQDSVLDAKLRAKPILNERFDHDRPDWALPVVYHQSPGIEKKAHAPVQPVLQAQKPQPFHAAIMAERPVAIPEPVVTVTPLREPVVPMREEPAPLPPVSPASVSPAAAADEFEQELDEFLAEQSLEPETPRHSPTLDKH